MAVFVLVEILLLKPDKWAFNDTITSATSGILYLLFKVSGKYLSAALYIHLYPRLHLVELPTDSYWTWLFCFVTQDFVYYLAHRAMHECAILWAFHQAHHSSEYYNFSTALRKGVFLEVGSAGFELLQAFIIPPKIFLPHKYLNLLYQFWLHTELVPSLGPLEMVLNTPASHRVHHGRNPYCIDRNYGGTLIIWDRLFGTYAAEREDETLKYGLVTNVNSFNQLWLQWFDFQVYGIEKGWMRNEKGEEYFPGWWAKLKVPFMPPGYFPGAKAHRFLWWWHMEDNTAGIPEVDQNERPYNPPVSIACKAYLFAQFLFVLGFASQFYDYRSVLTWPDFIAQIIIMLSTAQIFGYYFDKDPSAPFHDFLRCFGLFAYAINHPHSVLFIFPMFSIPCIVFLQNEEKMKKGMNETRTKKAIWLKQ